MNITYDYLTLKWDPERIEKIRSEGMHLCSSNILVEKYVDTWPIIDAVWDDDFNLALKRMREYEGCKHIFVSEICDIAVAEYLQVANIMNNKTINIYATHNDSEFVLKSRGFLLSDFNINILSCYRTGVSL